MRIRSVVHKGLLGLIERGDARKLPPNYVEKIQDIIAYLIQMTNIAAFFRIPRGAPHVLKGDRKGTYAVSVYANWRITFKYDEDENEIHDLDFEDYH